LLALTGGGSRVKRDAAPPIRSLASVGNNLRPSRFVNHLNPKLLRLFEF
jgi:hypothetical protein